MTILLKVLVAMNSPTATQKPVQNMGGRLALVLAASKMAVVHCLVKNQPERRKPVAVSAKAGGVLS